MSEGGNARNGDKCALCNGVDTAQEIENEGHILRYHNDQSFVDQMMIDPWLLDTVCKLLSKAKNHKVLEVTNCKESTIMTIVGVLTGRPDGCVSFAGDVLGNCSLSRR